MEAVDNLNVLVMSDALVSEAVKRTGEGNIPFIIGAWVVIIFVAIVSIDGIVP